MAQRVASFLKPGSLIAFGGFGDDLSTLGCCAGDKPLPVCSINSGVHQITFSPCGAFIIAACADGALYFVSVISGQMVFRMEVANFLGTRFNNLGGSQSFSIDCVKCAPCGQLIAIGCNSLFLHLINPRDTTFSRSFDLHLHVADIGFATSWPTLIAGCEGISGAVHVGNAQN